jgi:hypothetical protein
MRPENPCVYVCNPIVCFYTHTSIGWATRIDYTRISRTKRADACSSGLITHMLHAKWATHVFTHMGGGPGILQLWRTICEH